VQGQRTPTILAGILLDPRTGPAARTWPLRSQGGSRDLLDTVGQTKALTRNERADALPNPPFHRQRPSAVAHIAEKRTYGIIDLQHRSHIELHVFGVRQKGLVTGSDVADL
jgi:hypothetical protein